MNDGIVQLGPWLGTGSIRVNTAGEILGMLFVSGAHGPTVEDEARELEFNGPVMNNKSSKMSIVRTMVRITKVARVDPNRVVAEFVPINPELIRDPDA